MKIELTQKQYEALLKIVYLGSWMASSTKDEPEMEYENIEQRILSFAKKLSRLKHGNGRDT